MLSESLIVALRELNRADKLRAMQVLIAQLAVEEDPSLIAGAVYELLTPYGNESAAQTLSEFLDAAKKGDP